MDLELLKDGHPLLDLDARGDIWDINVSVSNQTGPQDLLMLRCDARGSGTVVRLSRDGEVIAVIVVGRSSGAIVGDGESVWVALPAEGLVARIDP